MKKTYMKPAIDVTVFSTGECLMQASFTTVTTEGLGTDADPLIDQLIGNTEGKPMTNPLSNAW